MKTTRWGLWIFLIVMTFALVAGGCGGGGSSNGNGGKDETPTPGVDRELTLTPSTLSLKVGETKTLTAQKNYISALEWLTGDESVATVTGSGMTASVTGVKAGATDITVVDDSGEDATCSVTVKDATTTNPGTDPEPGEDPGTSPGTDPGTNPSPGTEPGTTDPGTPGTPGTVPEKEPEQFIVIDEDNVLVENAVLQPNVYTLTNPEIVSLSFANKSDGKYAIAPLQMKVNNATKSYKVGDVVIAPPTEESTYGFSAVVESVASDSNGIQTLTLRQAKFDDILSEGDVFFSLHHTPSSFMKANTARGTATRSVTAKGFTDIWNSVLNGTYSQELPIDVTLADIKIPRVDVVDDQVKLKAEFADIFEISSTIDYTMWMKSSFSMLFSIKDNNLRKVMAHFPFEAGFDASFELEGSIGGKIEKTWIPSKIVMAGLVFIFGAPVPWVEDVEAIFSVEGEAAASIKFNPNIEVKGDFGFYWEDGEFHEIKNFERSGGTPISDPSMTGSLEIAIGPKITFKPCMAPFTSATVTAGGKVEHDLLNVSAPFNVDGKFKVKLKADLFEVLGNAIKNIINIGANLSFSVDVIDWAFWHWEGLAGPTPDTGNWIDVANTSWYSPYATEFTISTAEQLAGVAKLVNETDSSKLRDNFAGKTIRLVSDINLAGREWTPIGTAYNSFQGTLFDGGGGTIANLTITGERYVYNGLFGAVHSSAVVRNVNLIGVNIDISSSSASSAYNSSYAGGLAGGNSGTITNCTASGNVSSTTIGGWTTAYAGGLVGLNGGTITNCGASGEVSSSSSNANSNSSVAGGLVGSNNGTIKGNSRSSGSVSASSSLNESIAGGLVGNNGGTIEDSTSSSTTIGTASYRAWVGGLVGHSGSHNTKTIEGCTASGNVSASSRISSAGGLVGGNFLATIRNCKASGNVSSSSSQNFSGAWAYEGYGYAYRPSAGGLVGYNDEGTIEGCTASGKNISATTNYDTDDKRYAFTGGFIGWYDDYNNYNAIITNNHNETSVTPAIGRDGRAENPSKGSDDI